MFARTATRAILRAPSARVGLAPRLQQRAASTAPPAHKGMNYIRPIKDMPVDVYPLAFLVTVVVSASVFMVGYHLATDKQLRLLPERAKQW